MMHFRSITLAALLFLSAGLSAQQKYEAYTDLNAIRNDKLMVEIRVPQIKERKAVFIFPKIVPGTYDNSSFGRFMEDFKAMDAAGGKLRFKKIDVNAYKVKRAGKTASVSYLVNDTWDDTTGHYIFQPGGTNFVQDEQFVLNGFGLFGYFDGYTENIPYQVEISKPEHLYGATSLDRVSSTPSGDVFIAKNYVELVDQPILYTRPDTASYFEDGAKIGIAVHSPVDAIDAEMIREMVKPITRAASYVLGRIPTDEYWFLLHFFNWEDEEFANGGGAYGALEHKKSSLYFVPTYLGEDGIDTQSVKGTIYDMATHEFLHILAPLNLHSEEIAFFDFYETEMSRHLWLYEGVTEYLSIKSLLLGGVMDMDEFSEKMIGKIKGASRYRDISFTEMSENIIDADMQTQYGNVYEKGALLALILDLKVAEVTNGRMDLVDLILDLIDDYGMGKPFKDEELFDVITAKTAPEMRDFFRRYFEGFEELPIKELLEVCGVSYTTEAGEQVYSFGHFSMDFDANSGLLNITPREDNSLIPGTIAISKLNDEELSFRLVRNLLMNPSTNDPVKIEYVEGGKTRTITITPELGEGEIVHIIQRMEEPDEAQSLLFEKLFQSERSN